MAQMVWCLSCGCEVSLAHAVSERPCPSCGESAYFVADVELEHDALLSLAEQEQRVGEWAVAESALRRARDEGYITPADFNLSMTVLEVRRACYEKAVDLVSVCGGSAALDVLRSSLLREFDDYTVCWLLTECSCLRRVNDGSETFVEVSGNAAQETQG